MKVSEALAAFKAKQDEHNADVSGDLDSIKGQISTLQDQISQMQNSSGEISPEDQATLDAMEATAAELAAKADGVAGKVQNPRRLPPMFRPPMPVRAMVRPTRARASKRQQTHGHFEG